MMLKAAVTDLPLHMESHWDDGVLSQLQESVNLARHDVHCPLGNHGNTLLLHATLVGIGTYV